MVPEKGYAWESDIENIESRGKIPQADPSKVSDKATMRGLDQLGTLGSGNHYLEIQEVKAENIFEKNLCKDNGHHQARADSHHGALRQEVLPPNRYRLPEIVFRSYA